MSSSGISVNLLKQDGTVYDITNACATVSCSGSASQAVRTAEFEYLNNPYDTALKLPTVSVGDFLTLVDSQEGEVFYGQIFGIEKSSQIGTITYTAYDFMKHLLESQASYIFRNTTPEEIAKQVCGENGIPLRTVNGVPSLYQTNTPIPALICDSMTLYDIIMSAYTMAHKIDGRKYFAMIYKRGLGVYASEWIVDGFTLSDQSNIYSSDITESMKDTVNKIKIVDDKGNQIGEVKDDAAISLLGVFQQIYKQEEGIDPVSVAQNMLKAKPTQSIKISAIGDINCLSCYFVTVTDGATGLSGRYWISSDKHTWSNGVHTMELTLEFDALMNEVEAETQTEEEKEAERKAKQKAQKGK